MAFALLMLGACRKNDDNGAAEQKAKLEVLHLTTDVGNVDFYLNGSKQNVKPLTFGQVFGYAEVPAGDQTADFKIPVTNSIIVSAPVSFRSGVPYSLFLTGLSGNNTLKTILTVDTLAVLPAAGKAKIRFVQASSYGQGMDFLANDSLIFGARNLGSVSAFVEIDAKTYAFKINTAGTSQTLVLKDSLRLSGGSFYTLYARGTIGVDTPNVNAFTLSIMNHD